MEAGKLFCLTHHRSISFHPSKCPYLSTHHRYGQLMEKVEIETEPDVQKSRKALVEEAVARNDWPALRELSLLPGGFDGARVQAW
jgi:hypothetical protein